MRAKETIEIVQLDEESVAYKCSGEWYTAWANKLREFENIIIDSRSGFRRLEISCEGGWREAENGDDAYYVCVLWGNGSHTPLPIVLEMDNEWAQIIHALETRHFDLAAYLCARFEGDGVEVLDTPPTYHGRNISDTQSLKVNSHEVVVFTKSNCYHFHLDSEDGMWHCQRDDGGSPVWASSEGLGQFESGRVASLCNGWDSC